MPDPDGGDLRAPVPDEDTFEALAHLLSRLPHVVGVTDDAGVLRWLNPAGHALVGGAADGPLTTADVFTDAVFERYYADIRPVVAAGGTWQGTLPVRRQDGSTGEVDAVVVAGTGPGGEVRWLATLAVDVTESRRREEALAHAASHDPLTGLPNRALLLDRLAVALAVAARTGSEVALLALDLDGFKEVNDRLGHAAGDLLLRQVTARLERATRPGDTVARMGGDEFVVVVQPEHVEGAAVVAERIRTAVGGPPYQVGAESVHVTASIGLAAADHDAVQALARGERATGDPIGRPDPAAVRGAPDRDRTLALARSLLASADAGMYQAKRSGGDAVRSTTSDGDAVAAASRQLARALAEGAIDCAFDPVLDLLTGEVTSVELLARWDHPEHGRIPASRFGELARLTGYADLVFWSAARRGLRAAAEAGLAVPVDVNLSMSQLRGDDLAGRIADLAALAPPGGVRVELDEGALLDLTASETGKEALDALTAGTVRIVLEGHGRGGLPLGVLASLPLDAVKLDPGLTAAARTEPMALVLASRLARVLDVDCIGPRVESDAELPLLAVLGVTAVQGRALGPEWDRGRLTGEAGRIRRWGSRGGPHRGQLTRPRP